MKEWRHKLFFWLVFLTFTPVMTLFFVLDPDELIMGSYSYMPPCLTVTFFGIECPGCGMGRALCLIAHGRFSEAAQFNSASNVIFMLISILNLVSFCFCAHNLFSKYTERLKKQ